MKISEDLHHGDYRFTRTEEVEPTREAVLEFLRRSPYATPTTVVAGNKYVERTIDRLLRGERAGFGWSWYQPV